MDQAQDAPQLTGMAADDSQPAEEKPLVDTAEAERRLLSRPIARLLEQKEQGIVNPIVLAEAIGVRPQMIYSYIRQGKIKSSKEGAIRTNNTQKIVIDWDEAVAFAQRYLDKKARQQARIERELRGEK
jgi:hypothetical protein